MEKLLFIQLALIISIKYYLLFSVLLNIIFIVLVFVLYNSTKNKRNDLDNFNSKLNLNSKRKNDESSWKVNQNPISISREKEINFTKLEVENKKLNEEINKLKNTIDDNKEGSRNDTLIIDELKVEIERLNCIINSNDNSKTEEYLSDEINNTKSDGSNEISFGKCEVDEEIGYFEKVKSSTHQTPYFIEETNSTAQFYINSNNREAIANALNFYNIYIKAFCEPENIYNPSIHKSFIAYQDSKGTLEKEGEKFRVVEKLKIKFLEA